MMQSIAKVIWLTGLSGAGKTTLGKLLYQQMLVSKLPVVFLDGDEVRSFFESDLGYSRPERIQNVKRIAFAAKLLSDQGTYVIVANIAPYFEVRDFLRRKIDRYLQVYLRAPIETVVSRDVKGHYQKSIQGQITDIIGIDDSYEEPRSPDLTIETSKTTIPEASDQLREFLKKEGIPL